MRAVCTTLCLGLCLLSPFFAAAAEDPEAVSPEVIQNMNQRYDDFFIQKRRQEQLDEQRQSQVPRVKQARQEHAEQLEKARLAYVKNRTRQGENEALRKKWDEEQLQRKEVHEMARRRFVRQKDKAEALRRKGRTVPAAKEYDLEGY